LYVRVRQLCRDILVHSGKQDIIVVTSVVSAFIGAAIAIFFRAAEHLILKPVISIIFDDKEGCYGEATYCDFDNQQEWPIWYVRLRVEKTGLSSIKDCCAFVTKITKRNADGECPPPPVEVIDLGWAHREKAKYNVRDYTARYLLFCGRYHAAPVARRQARTMAAFN
jgi:hypothetical protein